MQTVIIPFISKHHVQRHSFRIAAHVVHFVYILMSFVFILSSIWHVQTHTDTHYSKTNMLPYISVLQNFKIDLCLSIP